MHIRDGCGSQLSDDVEPIEPPRSVLLLCILPLRIVTSMIKPINCMMAVTKVQDSMRYAE